MLERGKPQKSLLSNTERGVSVLHGVNDNKVVITFVSADVCYFVLLVVVDARCFCS